MSAITAGFLGSSSGIPASTLPTKSAPTSAALVNIPPPTRANNAWKEAPTPKLSIVVVTKCILAAVYSAVPLAIPVAAKFKKSVPNKLLSSHKFNTINHKEISNKARPTTVSPITAPERKAIVKPSFKDLLAAFAVLADA